MSLEISSNNNGGRMNVISSTKKIVKQILLIVLLGSSIIAQVKVLENGDKITWDGEYYDFRDSEGIKMIKIWVPPNTDPIRGVFISGHGGGSGDSRNFARDENIRDFATRLGFAVAGLHNFPGRKAYEEGAEVFFNALDNFSALGHHPELSNIPFVMYGSSNGGASTYGFVNHSPNRAICFVANVSAGYVPKIPVNEALLVPGIFIMGEFDALIGQRGIKATHELVSSARKKGALWSWANELKGHEDGFSFDVYMKLVEQAVLLRYPANISPKSGKIVLKELDEEDGWLADPTSWGDGITYIDSYQNYRLNKSEAVWLLNEDIAYVYRSMATYHNPVKLIVKEFDRTFNPNTDPGTMFSLGGPVSNPGEKITIIVETDVLDDVVKIEIFDGADRLGSVIPGKKSELTIILEANKQVYCLTSILIRKNGEIRTNNPFHFFIRDRELTWERDNTLVLKENVKSSSGSKNIGESISGKKPDHFDNILIAYGLDATMEESFSANDGKITEFWNIIDDKHDQIKMTQRKNAQEGAAFNFVITHDCNMVVKAAYGSDGIYLLFEVNDDNDVAWPNNYTGTEKEQFYNNFDAVDFMTDSRSVNEISKLSKAEHFVSRAYGMTSSTKQYQAAMGTPKERAEGFKRSLPDPWDFNSTFIDYKIAKKLFGIEIENIKTDYFYKAQEWFIPWSEFGVGFESEPDAGTRLAFAAGFNDRDKGEHFPVGVTSSGGSIKASNSIRWINRSDPWGSATAPYNWGEIELGDMLDNKALTN